MPFRVQRKRWALAATEHFFLLSPLIEASYRTIPWGFECLKVTMAEVPVALTSMDSSVSNVHAVSKCSPKTAIQQVNLQDERCKVDHLKCLRAFVKPFWTTISTPRYITMCDSIFELLWFRCVHCILYTARRVGCQRCNFVRFHLRMGNTMTKRVEEALSVFLTQPTQLAEFWIECPHIEILVSIEFPCALKINDIKWIKCYSRNPWSRRTKRYSVLKALT